MTDLERQLLRALKALRDEVIAMAEEGTSEWPTVRTSKLVDDAAAAGEAALQKA